MKARSTGARSRNRFRRCSIFKTYHALLPALSCRGGCASRLYNALGGAQAPRIFDPRDESQKDEPRVEVLRLGENALDVAMDVGRHQPREDADQKSAHDGALVHPDAARAPNPGDGDEEKVADDPGPAVLGPDEPVM